MTYSELCAMVASDAKVTGGTFILDNGEVVTFSLSAEYGWQQWGAPRSNLGVTMPLVQALLETAHEEQLLDDMDWDREEDEE